MRSVRVYLFALVAICLILATTAFAVIVAQTNAIDRQQVEAQTAETAKALSQAVDGKLERALGILAALRASQAAVAHDWATLDQQARAALQDEDAWIVVQDRHGQQLVNTRLPSGSALPAGAAPAAMWKEIASGRPHICDLVHGFVEQNIVCADAAIGVGRTPQYAISVIFRPNAFGSTITRDNVRAGNIATLVDRSGKVIWRNARPEQFIGRNATGPMMRALNSGSPSGVLESRSLEGVPMLSAFNRSALSGWSVIVGSPLEQIKTASKEALWRGTIVALVLLIIGAALATLLGARLVTAVRALAAAADPTIGQDPVRSTGIREIDAVGDALNRSFEARARSERHQQILIGELNHRVKNTLSVVQSLAHQTFRGNASPVQAIKSFEARLQALAAAHNLLTEERWEAASMQQIIQTALKPFCDPSRCSVEGPTVKVDPQKAVSIALAMHELATNASKYGALSVDSGRIQVAWSVEGNRFALEWRELDGPSVRAPDSDGFGMRLIRRSLAAELRGTVDIVFDPAGVVCRIVGQLG